MPRNASRTARALRWCAVIWLLDWVVGAGLSLAERHYALQWLEQGDTTVEIGRRMQNLALVSMGIHSGAVVSILLLSLSWLGGSDRRAWLGRAGWLALALHLVMMAVIRAWLADPSEVIDFELLPTLRLIQYGLVLAGMALLLAGTRCPAPWSIAFAVAASGWLGLAARSPTVSEEIAWWLWIAGGGGLQVGWAAGLWRATRLYPADADKPEIMGVPVGAGQRTAAGGLALVRAGLTARIAIAICAVVVFFTFGSSVGAGALVWLVAFAGIVATIVIGVGLIRYEALPEAGLEHGLVSLLIPCLAIGVLLDLFSAHATVRLLEITAQAHAAASFWGMPSMSEIESLQSQMQWSGRLASLLGMGAATALAVSLRKTARWMGDESLVRIANSLWLLTPLGGGAVLGGLALVQGGGIRDLGMLAVLGVVALVFAVWILSAWYRLLGGIIGRLSTPGEHST